MKTFFTLSLSLFLFSSFTSVHSSYRTPVHTSEAVSALENATFLRFNAHRHQKGIALSWTVNPDGIAGFIIERSYDGFYFQVIGETEAANRDTYRYKDESVFPGYLYYRITAVFQDDTMSESTVEMVRIVRNG